MEIKLEYQGDNIVEYEDGRVTGRTFCIDDGIIEKILLKYLREVDIYVEIE